MHPWWKDQPKTLGSALPEGFRYASDTNAEWLTAHDLLEMLGELEEVAA
jgi:hypothetical protein